MGAHCSCEPLPTLLVKAPTLRVKASTLLVKATALLVKAPTLLVKALTLLVKVPTLLVKAPTLLDKAPTLLVKAPPHLVKAPTLLVKAATLLVKAPPPHRGAPGRTGASRCSSKPCKLGANAAQWGTLVFLISYWSESPPCSAPCRYKACSRAPSAPPTWGYYPARGS